MAGQKAKETSNYSVQELEASERKGPMVQPWSELKDWNLSGEWLIQAHVQRLKSLESARVTAAAAAKTTPTQEELSVPNVNVPFLPHF